MRKSDKKSGFTMVEIVAVLVIIGIMVAVAAPKFVNMSQEARDKAAVAGVSECKASLSTAYAKAYLQQGGVNPTVIQVIDASGLSTNSTGIIFGDVVVTMEETSGGVNIKPISIDGANVTVTTNVYLWELPVN